jgi:hypothetical protein
MGENPSLNNSGGFQFHLRLGLARSCCMHAESGETCGNRGDSRQKTATPSVLRTCFARIQRYSTLHRASGIRVSRTCFPIGFRFGWQAVKG